MFRSLFIYVNYIFFNFSLFFQPRPSQQLPVPMRSQFEPRPRPHFGIKPGRECKFCKNNGESKDQFSSHVLRNPNTGQLICPVLRSHICEMCGATGKVIYPKYYINTFKCLEMNLEPVCCNFAKPFFYIIIGRTTTKFEFLHMAQS